MYPSEFSPPLKRSSQSVEKPLEVFTFGKSNQDRVIGTLTK